MGTRQLLRSRIPLLAVALPLLSGCYSLRVPVGRVAGVVREVDTGTLVKDADVRLQRKAPEGWKDLCRPQTTGKLGYFSFDVKHCTGGQLALDTLTRFRLICTAQGVAGQPSFPVSPYVEFNEVLVDDTAAKAEHPMSVADMHYHLSMRAQNLFGQVMYGPSLGTQGAVSDLFWYKSHRKLQVSYGGKWSTIPRLSEGRMRDLCREEAPATGRKARLVECALSGSPVRPKGKNNGMLHFSEATLPHAVQGHVRLGFNAISPFEHNLNDTREKRLVSKYLKSGVSTQWLARIGRSSDRERFITHWENFRAEYDLFKAQDRTINGGFAWSFLDKGSDALDTTRTWFVAVVEGGHALQHLLFPNAVGIDLMHRTRTEQDKLVKQLLAVNELLPFGRERTLSPHAKDLLLQLHELDVGKDTLSLAWKKHGEQADKEGMDRVIAAEYLQVDTILLLELKERIAAMKALEAPSIRMVTVSHLSYNGMTGHAPALDDGGVISSIIAQKVYGIRVSEDPSYLKQWRGLFFTVPGPNQFGKAMMRGLLSTDNGHRILLDLKHSDLMTRKFFYDSLMVVPGARDTIPPICSHCAVTGLSEVYGSPFNNEYSLLKAPFTTTFYPFGINLYDEEILRIHRNGGIIGLPLEQRVLGGYVNKRTEWALPLKPNGELSRKLERSAKRFVYQRRYLRHLRYHARLRTVERPTLRKRRNVRVTERRLEHARDEAFERHSHGAARTALYQAMIFTEERLHVTDDTKWLEWMRARLLDTSASAGDADTVLIAELHTRKWTRTDKRVLDATTEDYISAEPFLQNLFYIVDRIMDDKEHCGNCPVPDVRHAWRHVCIGSDLDGLIDPIDICATAGMYPYFRDRLAQFIPIFLRFRSDQFDRGVMLQGRPRGLEDYFTGTFTLDEALDMLFYRSLRDFTVKNL